MPWSGGSFTRIYNWVDDKNAGIPITASRMDGDSDDFASGINNCIAKDGSNTPTSAMNWGNFRLTGLGPGTNLTDAANIQQVQTGILNWGIAGGTSDALTLTISPADVSIDDGTLVCVRAGFANATTTPTFAFNATTARTITKIGGLPLAPFDIEGALAEIFLRYNSANTRWELLNPANVGMVLLATSTISNVATVDFTSLINSTYDQYVFRFTNVVPATNNVEFWVRYSQAASFITSGSYNHVRGSASSAPATAADGAAAATKIVLAATVPNTAGSGVTGEMTLGGPSGTTNLKFVYGHHGAVYVDTNIYSVHFNGDIGANTTAVDGIRFMFSSGNLLTGFIAMYGIKKS